MERIERQYTEPMMRPPQEATSLLLRATEGCTWNKCKFCYVSRGYRFRAVSPAYMEEEARRCQPYFRPDTKVYLTGSNPFALPVRKLEEYLAILRKYYPQFERVSLQARIDDIERKKDSELLRLKELGIRHLYIGTENGNEAALSLMAKGHTAADTVSQLQRLDQAGITYTNFYVLGLLGKGHGRESGEATAAMFNQVHPERITTTGMTIFADTPVAEMVRNGEFAEASEREKIEELYAFLSGLEIDVFYDGIHYLNPVHYRFNTGDKKAREEVLADLREILESCSEEELELMVDRKRMQSL